MNNKLKKILKQFKKELKQLYNKNLASVILYGSQARNDFTNDSDVDILILLDKEETKPIEEIRRINNLLSDFSLNFNRVFSCIFMTKHRYENEKSPLILNIKKEGIVL